MVCSLFFNCIIKFVMVFAVDRILHKQRAEREAAERARREQAKEMEKLLSDVQPSTPDHPAPAIASSTTEPVQKPLSPTSTGDMSMASKELDDRTHRPTSSLFNQFQNLRRKFGVPGKGESAMGTTADGQQSSGPSRPSSPEGRSQSPPIPGGFSGTGDSHQRPQSSVTPLSNIGTLFSHLLMHKY